MDAESTSPLELEIAHILFVDLVGYSKLLIDDQREIQQQLNDVVRHAEEVRTAEGQNKLVRLPTGDGMALVFYSTQEAPARCALQIAQALEQSPKLKLRMGIHSGPVSAVADVNERANVAGAGINIAQRVMDCGDAGHILLSKRVADDLAQYRYWQPYLHDLGQFEVKHGVKIDIVNLYSDKVGNAELPSKLQQERKKQTALRRRKRALVVGLVLLAIAVPLTLSIFLRRPGPTVVTSIPEKSIAVLPFESLSDDKENAYFADGMQDDILTELTKVADLKVISRTSVMQYRGAAKNLREIARVLQVAHVLEGSVRKVANHIRVNAQLIDARTDAHLWAENYDRDLADVFAIQSELTQRIVAQLKSNLSPSEKSAIEEKPTSDLEAYDLYLRGKAITNNLWKANDPHGDLLKALEFFKAAAAHDPNFALAHCEIAHTCLNLYWWWGYAAADLAQADSAMQVALRLAPKLGEAHLRQADLHYHGHRNYDEALKELVIAERLLPNSNTVFGWKGAIQRRKGNWAGAIPSYLKTIELDPLKEGVYYDAAGTYKMLRNYSEAERVLDLGLSKIPEAGNLFRQEKALLALARGDTKTARLLLSSASKEFVGPYWFARVAMLERNYAETLSFLASVPESQRDADVAVEEAFALRKQGDAAKAQTVLSVARERLQNQKLGDAGEASKLSFLALLDAALGRKEEALRESQQAVDKLPIARDAVDGPLIALRQAQVYALIGDRNGAIARLAEVAKIPAGPSVGDLLDPFFDDLRSDPRFAEILADAATPLLPKMK
jgi:TolB-like protein